MQRQSSKTMLEIQSCQHLPKRRNRLSGISTLTFYKNFCLPIFILRFCEIKVNFRNCLEPTKAPAQMSESLIFVITLLKEELSQSDLLLFERVQRSFYQVIPLIQRSIGYCSMPVRRIYCLKIFRKALYNSKLVLTKRTMQKSFAFLDTGQKKIKTGRGKRKPT